MGGQWLSSRLTDSGSFDPGSREHGARTPLNTASISLLFSVLFLFCRIRVVVHNIQKCNFITLMTTPKRTVRSLMALPEASGIIQSKNRL